MEDIFEFLKNYEFWIYALLGGVAFIYLRKLIIAWQDWRTAVFGLEREGAQRRFSSALTVVGLLAGLILAQFVIVSFVVPSVPKVNYLLTPTIDLLATPTITLQVSMTSDAQGTIEPTQALADTGCIPGQIEWSYPQPNSEISGTIDLSGTINVENFGFYKYEYSQVGSDTWVAIAAKNEINPEGDLGSWNMNQLIPGDYYLRLIVVDNDNNEYPPCEIPVRVIAEE